MNGEKDKVTFSMHSTSNVFCNTECEYKFTDLRTWKIVKSEKLNLKTTLGYDYFES